MATATKDQEMKTKGQTQAVKTSVNLPQDAIEALREIADDRGTTVAEVIRRAIWVEKYLHDETRKGAKVLIEDDQHRLKELVIR